MVSSQEINHLLKSARLMKQHFKKGTAPRLLKNKVLGMIFQKSSTRTRISFEVAMVQLGGQAIYLSANDLQLKRGETIADTAQTLSRYLNGITARVYSHQDLVDLANNATIPVINALSDYEHPCQALADLLTIYEKKKTFRGIKITYLGDGNNVCHSLLLGVAQVGGQITVATPPDYSPSQEVIEKAKTNAQSTGAEIEIINDPFKAVKKAHIIYTDVWTSMGQEEEYKKRLKTFQDYQINHSLLKRARSDVLVMHCLPAHRGEEITAEVIDGPHSIVFDQAENRLHIQKALLAQVLK
ncbi:ornithine carbamoyltransferase [Planctomycetota bacterium]